MDTPSTNLFQGLKQLNEKSLEKAALKKKISLTSISFFAQSLSALLAGGLPLINALEALVDQTEDRYLKIILKWIIEKVAAGSSLSAAMQNYPRAFPVLIISMVQAGEASGALPMMMDKVASYFDSTVKLQKRVKGALSYPIGVIVLAFCLVNALMIFVVPQFTQMFASFGANLPLPTQILVSTSNVINHYGIFLAAAIFGIVIGIRAFFRTQRGRCVKDFIIFHLPIVGKISCKIATSRFCRTYATLLQSGVQVMQALQICSFASDNTYVEDACKWIGQNLTEGRLLSEALGQISYFPKLVRHMAKAGEQSGNLETMIIKAADFYDTEIDATVGALTSLMEPLLITFLGIVVGGISMAIFMPVFQMGNLVSQ